MIGCFTCSDTVINKCTKSRGQRGTAKTINVTANQPRYRNGGWIVMAGDYSF